MRVEPKPNASVRTKNRLREHRGFKFLGERKGRPGSLLLEKDVLLFVCSCHPDDPWVGWLPKDEVTTDEPTRA